MTPEITHYHADVLDLSTARELAGKTGVLLLDVTEIDKDAVEALARFQGELIRFEPTLPQICEASGKVFLKLAAAGCMTMAWLRAREHLPQLSRSTILSLARYADAIDLEGLHDLTADEVEMLDGFQGEQLLIDVEILEEASAKILASTGAELLRLSIGELPPPVATAMSSANHIKELQIVIEKDTLSRDAAHSLASFQGDTLGVTLAHLPGVEAMDSLAGFSGHLVVCLPTLTSDIATVLANSSGTLELHFDTATKDVVETITQAAREITNIDDIATNH